MDDSEAPPATRTAKKRRARSQVACLACRGHKTRCDVLHRGFPCTKCFLDKTECVVVPRVNRRSRDVLKSTPLSPKVEPPCQKSQFPKADSLFPIDHPRNENDKAESEGNGSGPNARRLAEVSASGHISYTEHKFLRLGNLANLAVQDVAFLESQGCMKVPVREHMEVFIQQYFRHIHPLMPIIQETRFWSQLSSHPTTDKTSLLLLQAMLFVSCHVVSPSILQSLSFESARVARAELYRRAKLLHNFDAEIDPLILGQAAVLLSYWVPHGDPGGCKSNTTWLMRAIRHARDAGADRHRGFVHQNLPRYQHDPNMGSRINDLKRLWWSCIVRDRIIALGLRRKSLIDPHSLGAESASGFDALDLSDEVHGSQVYDSETKRLLIRLFVRLTKLCVILTDLLQLVAYPDDGDVWKWGRHPAQSLQHAQRIEDELGAWDLETRDQIPVAAIGVAAQPLWNMYKSPTQLHVHLVYLYYYSALASFSQHRLLQLSTSGSSVASRVSTAEIVETLQQAVSGFAEHIRRLTDVRLASWLPLSAAALSVLPLAVYMADFLIINNGLCDLQSVEKKTQQRRALEEVLDAITSQFGGLVWFQGIVRQMRNLAEIWNTEKETTCIDDKSRSQLYVFLRLALTADKSLSTATYPSDGEVPTIPALSLTACLEWPPVKGSPCGHYDTNVNPTDPTNWKKLLSVLDRSWPVNRPSDSVGYLGSAKVTDKLATDARPGLEDSQAHQLLQLLASRHNLSEDVTGTIADESDSPGTWLVQPHETRTTSHDSSQESHYLDLYRLFAFDDWCKNREDQGE